MVTTHPTGAALRGFRVWRVVVLGLALVFITPSSFADPVAINPDGDADADFLAISGTGNATAAGAVCGGGICKSGIALSGTGSAWGGMAAVSGTNDAYSGLYCPPVPVFCTGGTAVSGTGDAQATNAAISLTGDAEAGAPISVLGTCHEWWSEQRPPCVIAIKSENASAWWIAISPEGSAGAHWAAFGWDEAHEGFATVSVMGDAGQGTSSEELNATFWSVSVFGDASACEDDPTCTAISVFGTTSGSNSLTLCEVGGACSVGSRRELLP